MPSCLYWCIPLQICLTCSIHLANNTSDASIFFLLRLIRFMKENDLWNAFRFFFSSFFLRTDFLSGREHQKRPSENRKPLSVGATRTRKDGASPFPTSPVRKHVKDTLPPFWFTHATISQTLTFPLSSDLHQHKKGLCKEGIKNRYK